MQVLLQDVHGVAVPLRTLLGGKPAILVPVYYRCKNLCDAVRAGIAQAVAASGLSPATDFSVLLLSFDPREGPPDADAAQHEDAAANRSRRNSALALFDRHRGRHRCGHDEHRIPLLF